MPGDRPRLALLLAAFFLSGFAALVYQTVWQRMLGMFAGSDSVTAAIVVGAFLLGLGVGTLVASLIADRLSIRQAVLGFILCEIGVALFALASRYLLYDFIVVELAPVVSNRWAIFFLCFLGLLVPTFLMGMALPLLTKAVVGDIDNAAARIGWLYGLNTLGAGLGTLAGGWYLIGSYGFEVSIHIAAGLNGLAAALALGLLTAGGRRAAGAMPAEGPRPTRSNDGGALGLRTWAPLVFLSGFAIVSLEILWVRVLGVVGQYHAYTFATILGLFLLADGLGMTAAALWLKRVVDPRPAFFLLQAIAALYAIMSLAALFALCAWPPAAALISPESSRHTGAGMSMFFLVTALTVIPPAFLLGMSFPLVQKAVQRDMASVGFRVGIVQLANIVGNATGSLFTGLIALHVLGSSGTARLVAALALLLLGGWLMVCWQRGRAPPRSPGALAVWVGLAVAILAFPGNQAFWTRVHQVKPDQDALLAEDRSGLAVLRHAAGAGDLFVQGYSQSRIPFLPIHILLGAVGPLVHPDPQSVFVIGVGIGGTPYGAGLNAKTNLIHSIELVRPVYAVIEAYVQRYPGSATAAMWRDPRYRFDVGDGRREIFLSGNRYDVIEADAILPQSSHSGLLYSREFMEQVLASLKPGGIAVQWAATERTIATFRSVFPHVVLLRPVSILLGSDRPMAFDRSRLRALLDAAPVAAYLARAGVDVPALAERFAAPPLEWSRDDPPKGEINTDLFPRDEFYLNNLVQLRPVP